MAKFASYQYNKDFSSVYDMLEQAQRNLGGQALAGFMSREIYPYLRERALNRFSAGGDDASGKWHSLQPVTQEIRSHYGYGASGPINKRTGELMDYVERATPQLIIGADSVTMQYPGNLPEGKALDMKFKTAQRGRSRPRTSARPVIAFSATDYTVIHERLQTFVTSGGRAI